MMKILHTITATVNPADTRTELQKSFGSEHVRYSSLPRIEMTYTLVRRKKLTCAGAQRILRREYRQRHRAHGNLIVTRVETMIDGR